MKKTIFYRLFKNTVILCLKVVNVLTPKKGNNLFFIPHENCKNDNYDIINNGADNVLKLCDSILHDERFRNNNVSILVYDASRIGKYEEYCRSIGFEGNLNFVPYDNKIDYFRAYCHASIIFTDNFYTPFWYKINRQIAVCLGYFVVPFKDDFFKIKIKGYKQSLKDERLRNKSYDYHLSTSVFCSRELSVDSLLYLPKYINLGFPRNDIFFEDSTPYRKKIEKVIGFCPKTILAFVPTHRDYERSTSILYDKKQVHKHSLFGQITIEDETSLYKFLEEENIVIIAKAHPIQEQSVLTNTNSNRIYYFSDLIKDNPINLQEILAASDMMATDYSTACFDYLLTGRPSIFYFYDYEKERKSRMFFIDPITPLCAGDIVYDIKGFIEAIKENLKHPDKYLEKRLIIQKLLFYHYDGKATERVKNFVLDLGK